ncbi:MAG TPA: hypothetical protein VFT74_04395, partial [Isosphaeraceae bacterium]|nr:hypothetical protein [Isosphaeraceae bacterium]
SEARTSPRLYDLETDPAEAKNLADRHPDTVDRLTALAETGRRRFGDGDRQGEAQRPCGHVENPSPRRLP